MLPETNRRKRSTFASAEMIVSVAVLAILAGFSVVMFISAKNNNAKSYDLYKAMTHAVNMVETIKGVPHPELLSKEDFEARGALFSANESGAVICMYFDETWAPISPGGPESQACYSVQAELSPRDAAHTNTTSGFHTYDITVRVLRLMPYTFEKRGQSELVSIETLKCYTPYACTEGAAR